MSDTARPGQGITVQELDQLVAELFEQRQKIEAMEEQVTTENKKLAFMKSKIVDYLKELGREDFKSASGSVSVKAQWRVNLPKSEEDRAAFFAHLKDRGIFDSMITVNSNTLNSYFREEWEAAQESGDAMNFKMPGIGEPKLFEDLYVRKGKQ